MKTVVIASNNTHKVSEIESALNFEGWEFRTLREMGITSEPEEDADTFEGNARIKATAAREASGGLASLADDSARYAGESADDAANNRKLLEELADVPWEERTARFVCTLVFIDEDGTEQVARGTIEGHIGYEEQGSNGFGYDPLFFPDAYAGEKTLAEVSQAEKNSISHRGNALRALKAQLANG